MSEAGEIVGMVDVLKLTYATLDQINSMSTGEGEGPAWQKFWLSMDHETESAVSGEGSRLPHTPLTRSAISPDVTRPEIERGNSVMPHESASQHGDESPDRSALAGTTPLEEVPFAFKFKALSGRVHRLQVTATAGMGEFVSNITSKLGGEVDAVGGEPSVENGKLGKSGFALSYLDNEGDTVSITTNQDLVEAIAMAQKNKSDKVDLFVHEPGKPPLTATVVPQPGLVPAKSVNKTEHEKLLAKETEEEEGGGEKAAAKQSLEQVIAGVPNELLLPGAVAALTVVIVGVFAFSRSSSR